MTKNQILVQNIETFATITRLTVDVESGETATERIDQYFSKNANWGIVSLDDDADGEYMNVLLVAPIDGPDFEMDMTTGEMEPVESVDPAVELATKVDIALEMDMNDVPQEQIVAMLDGAEHFEAVDVYAKPAEKTITPAKPRKARKTKTKSRTKAKGAKMSTTQPKRIRNFEILCAYIEANPGVSRTDVFNDASLLLALRTSAQIAAIGNGDKLEVKRWNRRLNFLIRESKRQGVDIQIERKGRVAHYTIVPASGQLELPFDEAAEKRNAAITGDIVTDEVVIEKPVVDVKRADEPENVSLNFEDLLAQLDDDAATITSDDQVAFNEAKEMLKK